MNQGLTVFLSRECQPYAFYSYSPQPKYTCPFFQNYKRGYGQSINEYVEIRRNNPQNELSDQKKQKDKPNTEDRNNEK